MERIEEKHARVLLDYSIKIKRGEKLSIRGSTVALSLMRALYKYALQRGALPQMNILDEPSKEILLKYGKKEQIQYIPANEYKLIKDVDALIWIIGSENTKYLTNVNPEKVKLHTQGRSRYLKTLFDRMAKKEIRSCGTQFPTQAEAQEANMSQEEYREFVYSSCMLHKKDPIKAWKEVSKQQKRICDKLNKKKMLHIVSKDTDLTLSVKGRKWINCDGRENFPDGEVFTGPVENSVNGHIRFSFPGIYANREVEDIQLTFEKGKVVDAKAAKGEDLLKKALDIDPGARYVGEVAIGTNNNIKRFTRNMLFDEKIGGTVHLALGRSFPESKGKNVSAIHWDMLCDMRRSGKIFADGELVYERGKFLI